MTWNEFNQSVANPQWTDSKEIVFVRDDRVCYGSVPRERIPAAIARAIVVNMKRHCAFMGKPPYIVVTGGFGKKEVAQIVADVWQCPVYVRPKVNRVAWGSAIWSMAKDTKEPLSAIAERLCPKGERIDPDLAHADFYRQFEQALNEQFPG